MLDEALAAEDVVAARLRCGNILRVGAFVLILLLPLPWYWKRLRSSGEAWSPTLTGLPVR